MIKGEGRKRRHWKPVCLPRVRGRMNPMFLRGHKGVISNRHNPAAWVSIRLTKRKQLLEKDVFNTSLFFEFSSSCGHQCLTRTDETSRNRPNSREWLEVPLD